MRYPIKAHLRLMAQEVGWGQRQDAVSKPEDMWALCAGDTQLCKFALVVSAIMDRKFTVAGSFNMTAVLDDIKELIKGSNDNLTVVLDDDQGSWSYADSVPVFSI